VFYDFFSVGYGSTRTPSPYKEVWGLACFMFAIKLTAPNNGSS